LKILITNDDGIHAFGLELLAEVCRGVGDVSIVAPDRENSGASRSVTLHRPLRPVRRGEGMYQVDGTPTDCILMALGSLLQEPPDFIFSGINHGPNLGEDVLYSGTVAGAMEGLAYGIPGVAISLAGRHGEMLEGDRKWIEGLVSSVVRLGAFPTGMLLNINIPPIPGDEIKGIRATKLGKRKYSGALVEAEDRWGRRVHWVGGGELSWSGGEDCDFQAIEDGFISVTPLHTDLTDYARLEEVGGWKLGG
jgi:5'-nucleotidase